MGLKNPLENPQYAFVSPLLSQTKRNLWDDLKRVAKKFPTSQIDIHENDLRCDIWRTREDRIRIQLFGAENPESLAGYKLDGAVLDESQDMPPTFFGKIVRPMLSDRMGWALHIGTVRGKTYFWQLRKRYRELMAAGDPDYFEAEYKASTTGIIPQKELDDAKREMGDELFMQEYELSTDTPNKGAYYSEYLTALEKADPPQITRVPFDPRLPVDCGFDLGMDDHTSIWFCQQFGAEYRIIDYIEGQGKGIPEYCSMLRQKPYDYGELLLPHDAAVRELGTGKSREEIFRSLRFKTRIVRRQSLADGIQAVRSILPRCWFDADKTKVGYEALKEYSRSWDEKNQVFSDHPRHDWASHPADAFRTLALGLKESKLGREQRPQVAEMDYDVFA